MTRFDLEHAIMSCWHTADDLDMLADYTCEEEPDLDTMLNTLLGLKNMHEIRMTKLWNIFSAMISAGKFKDCCKSFDCPRAQSPAPADELDGDGDEYDPPRRKQDCKWPRD